MLSNRTTIVAFAAIILVALGVRLAPLLGGSGYLPLTDAADFDRHAVSIVTSGQYPDSAIAPGSPTAFRPPGLPLLLAAVYEVSGTSTPRRWKAARLAMVGLGLATVLLVGLVGGQLWGRKLAMVAAGIAAVYLPFIAIGSSILSESLFIPLELAALAAVIEQRRRPGWRWAALAGLLTGMAALTRSNGLVLALALAALLWSRRPRLLPSALLAPSALLFVTALTIAPWTVRNLTVVHKLVPISTQGGFALAGVYNSTARSDPVYPAGWRLPQADPATARFFVPGVTEVALDQALTSASRGFIAAHPTYVGEVAFWNALRAFDLLGPGPEATTAEFLSIDPRLVEYSVYAFWLLASLALMGASTRLVREAPLLLWSIPLAFVSSIVLISGLMRYRLPADPFFILLAALGLVAIAGWLLGPRGLGRRRVSTRVEG